MTGAIFISDDLVHLFFFMSWDIDIRLWGCFMRTPSPSQRKALSSIQWIWPTGIFFSIPSDILHAISEYTTRTSWRKHKCRISEWKDAPLALLAEILQVRYKPTSTYLVTYPGGNEPIEPWPMAGQLTRVHFVTKEINLKSTLSLHKQYDYIVLSNCFLQTFQEDFIILEHDEVENCWRFATGIAGFSFVELGINGEKVFQLLTILDFILQVNRFINSRGSWHPGQAWSRSTHQCRDSTLESTTRYNYLHTG